MADDTAETETGRAHRDVKAELDERRIAKAVAIALPVVTASVAAIAGVLVGAPMAILILAAGMLLGVISLFWASLRILSGDAALSPELEALDATAHAVDALSSRKKMLIRALKDLDNERALGKLEDEDYEQLSHTYRGELKEVMVRIDASLAPHRPKAEDAARSYLVTAGIAKKSAVEPAAAEEDEDADEEDEADADADAKADVKADADAKNQAEMREIAKTLTTAKAEPKTDASRVACSSCSTSNETDATFCKKCGASLAKEAEAVDEA